jgi:hypothetical protein
MLWPHGIFRDHDGKAGRQHQTAKKNILWMSTNKNQERYELKQQIGETSAAAILNSSRNL